MSAVVFHPFAALGQFERDLIQERTRAGLTAAMVRGRAGGRKPVVTDDKLRRAREHIARGLTVREAAMRVKVGKTALYEALKMEPARSHARRLPACAGKWPLMTELLLGWTAPDGIDRARMGSLATSTKETVRGTDQPDRDGHVEGRVHAPRRERL